VNAFADTSFLCALYRVQDNSPAAYRLAEGLKEPVTVSSLVLFAFRQSVRLQAFRFSSDRTQGYSPREAARVLDALRTNVETGALFIAPTEWSDVHSLAEELSARNTVAMGIRSMDTLHVATALHLGVKQFLTFDAKQAALAKAAGLKARP
jgi:predicted nucleic acid-binding protein